MSSQNKGKEDAVNWIKSHIEPRSRILDVGACDGLWSRLLEGMDYRMDAVEVWEPNIRTHNLAGKYDHVFNKDIREFHYYTIYDLAIFGDILEHLTVEEAQAVLKRAWTCCENILVAVPFRWPQEAIYGNPYEKHLQPDLTHEIFMERYPGFEPLVLYDNYGYYTKMVHNGPFDCDKV